MARIGLPGRCRGYAYNGVGQVVGTDYLDPSVEQVRYGGASGSYPDLDRFDRVVSDRWTAYGGTPTDFYDVDLTWDRNSNITLAEDNVHAGFDVEYTIDGIDRLTQAEEPCFAWIEPSSARWGSGRGRDPQTRGLLSP
jgi:hypothetical protein